VATLALEGFRWHGLGPLDLSIPAGTCVAVAGSSGTGKTLLLRAVADLDPHEGTARLDGVACASLPAPLWRRRVTYVPAESRWWATRVAAHFRAPAAPALAARLARLGLPATALDWEVARLSTGERQRLGLARALEGEPGALLLDEPTANLDAGSAARVEAEVAADRAGNGTAVLWVAHDAALARRVAVRRLCIADGRVFEEADPCR